MSVPHLFDAVDPEQLRERRSGKWSTYPGDVLPAWVAEMDFPVAECIRAELLQMVDRSDLGYPTLSDKPLQAIRAMFTARMQQQYGWEIAPERVELLTDVVQGLSLAVRAYVPAKAGVVVQPPIYPPFLDTVRENDRLLLLNQLQQQPGGDYAIDFDALESLLVPQARALFLCNPHNPTGRVLTRAELEKLADLALRHDLLLVSDEIHADIVYPGHAHIPIASLSPEVARRTITLTSATKSFSIPGLRCAVAAFGSAAMQAKLQHMPRNLRGGINILGLYATLAAWRDGGRWLAACRAYLAENRAAVRAFAQRYLPHGSHPEVQGTYLAWLDCRHLGAPVSPYNFFLERAKVALSHGETFGPGGQGFVRLNFATSRAILQQILAQMAQAIEALPKAL